MKTWSAAHPKKPRHVRCPAFVPVPLRGRSDGWTPERQAAFLGALAETGSVMAAARAVGMARETAYRLRARAGAESFAAAWDAVLGRPAELRRKVTRQERERRAIDGLLKPVFSAGRHVATHAVADNRALLGALGDRSRGRRRR